MRKKKISRLLCMTLLIVTMFTASSFAAEVSEERQFADSSVYENTFPMKQNCMKKCWG